MVFAFILCWLPFHVGRYLFSKSFEPGSLEIAQISQYCNLVSFVLFYLSAAINPILYNIMSKKYRVAVFKLLGVASFSQRKLSTLKDESSRGWTKSSINTWPDVLLSSSSLTILHGSHRTAGLGKQLKVNIGIRDTLTRSNWRTGKTEPVGHEKFDSTASRHCPHTLFLHSHCLWFHLLLLVLGKTLKTENAGAAQERTNKALLGGEILNLICYSTLIKII